MSREERALGHRFDETLGRAAGRWVASVDRRPGWVALAALVLTTALGAFAATHLGVNADPDAMISGDLPFRVREHDFQRSFRAAWDEMLVLVESDRARPRPAGPPTRWPRGSRRARDLFAGVQVVGGGEFFRRNALLYLDVPELEDLADRLAAVQPFLAEIARDPSADGRLGPAAPGGRSRARGHRRRPRPRGRARPRERRRRGGRGGPRRRPIPGATR